MRASHSGGRAARLWSSAMASRDAAKWYGTASSQTILEAPVVALGHRLPPWCEVAEQAEVGEAEGRRIGLADRERRCRPRGLATWKTSLDAISARPLLVTFYPLGFASGAAYTPARDLWCAFGALGGILVTVVPWHQIYLRRRNTRRGCLFGHLSIMLASPVCMFCTTISALTFTMYVRDEFLAVWEEE
ncbi:hypothetical protein F4775DRAFT_579568 [Biscogniauxia sp. FL1348]|nr:hypothetical protein F4775DRAFT_579568 [Biscogniauxia sp. FL1348]